MSFLLLRCFSRWCGRARLVLGACLLAVFGAAGRASIVIEPAHQFSFYGSVTLTMTDRVTPSLIQKRVDSSVDWDTSSFLHSSLEDGRGLNRGLVFPVPE